MLAQSLPTSNGVHFLLPAHPSWWLWAAVQVDWIACADSSAWRADACPSASQETSTVLPRSPGCSANESSSTGSGDHRLSSRIPPRESLEQPERAGLASSIHAEASTIPRALDERPGLQVIYNSRNRFYMQPTSLRALNLNRAIQRANEATEYNISSTL